MLDDQNS
jgi:hypothetical protein